MPATTAAAPPPIASASSASSRRRSSASQAAACDHGDHDASARVREQDGEHATEDEQHAVESSLRRSPQPEHEREVAEKRERVPEPDRRAQAREPPVIRIERGNALREQRVSEHDAEQRGEAGGDRTRCVRDERGDEQPEDEKREVDERRG